MSLSEDALFAQLVKGLISERTYTFTIGMRKYHVGVRVMATNNINKGIRKGDKGVVCYNNTQDSIGVRWDKEHHTLHDCSGHCEDNHGWYVHPEEIKPLESEATGDE